jgi:ribosomal protein S18 acetylase RimI-like enzyme
MNEQHRRHIQGGERIQIRTASSSDALGIAHVHCAAINEAYSDLWSADELACIFANFPDRVEAWRDHLSEGSSTALVAEVDGDIVGFVEFEPWEDEGSPETVASVTNLSVDPEEWGRGVGEALMREAMARLRDGGWVEVVLSLREGARRAVGLFERLGFRWDKAFYIRALYGNRADRVLLRRPLGGPE